MYNLGLELASFNNYRLYSILPLFITESRGDHLPLAKKLCFFYYREKLISANIGETRVREMHKNNIIIVHDIGTTIHVVIVRYVHPCIILIHNIM